jgi:DNA topoisomerase-1
MPGLTAKVFRTFRASYEFQKYLTDFTFDKNPEIMAEQLNLIYLNVAKILNHVVSKTDKAHAQQIDKLRERLYDTSLTAVKK